MRILSSLATLCLVTTFWLYPCYSQQSAGDPIGAPERLLVSVFDLPRLELEDVIHFNNNDVLRGQVMNADLTMRTPYAEMTIPLRHCAGVSFEGSKTGNEIVATINRDRITGIIEDRMIRFRIGSSGTEIPIRKEKVRYLILRRSPAELKFLSERKQSGSFVMANGDVLNGRPTSPGLLVRAAYGELTVPFETMAKVEIESDENIRAKVSKRNGEQVTGMLQTEEIPIGLDIGISLEAVYMDRFTKMMFGSEEVLNYPEFSSVGKEGRTEVRRLTPMKVERVVPLAPRIIPPIPLGRTSIEEDLKPSLRDQVNPLLAEQDTLGIGLPIPTAIPRLIATPTLSPLEDESAAAVGGPEEEPIVKPAEAGSEIGTKIDSQNSSLVLEPIRDEDRELYVNAEYKFRLQRPSKAWTFITSSEELDRINEEAEVALRSDKGVYSMVIVERLPDTSLKEYVDAIKPSLEDLTKVADEEDTIAGFPGRKRVWVGAFEIDNGNGTPVRTPYRFFYALVARGELKFQIISWCSEEVASLEVVQEIRTIQDSFAFVNPTSGNPPPKPSPLKRGASPQGLNFRPPPPAPRQ